MSISFKCPFCEMGLTVPDGTRGKWATCRTCKNRIQVPRDLVTAENYLAAMRSANPNPGLSKCPYCIVDLNPRPTRGRKCSSCGEKFYIRKGIIYTSEQARAYDEQYG